MGLEFTPETGGYYKFFTGIWCLNYSIWQIIFVQSWNEKVKPKFDKGGSLIEHNAIPSES